MSDAALPNLPSKLGGYEVVRRLGAGGMAEVFVAKKQGAEGTFKILVVKRILPAHGASRRFRTMFVEEAQLATRLNHPNIVQVYDFQDYGDEGQLLSMEYVEGLDLGKLMSATRAKGARVPPWVAAYVVSEVAKGLHYAHERKDGGRPLEIVHRDVSPQNVLLSFEGAVKIADFGIASANLFRDDGSMLKGKYGYMSPEQARGDKVDRRTDVYALGVVLHELLAGRPLHGTLAGDELLDAVRSGVVEPPSTFVRDVPPELEAIALRALASDPDARFQTAREMSSAIVRAMMTRQELVDAATVESTIARFVDHDAGAALRSEPPGPGSMSLGDADRSLRAIASTLSRADRVVLSRPTREVRHVAVLALVLSGLKELAVIAGPAAAAAAADRIRTTLDGIAYKRGARWTWEDGSRARAVVGLLANPSRAASDAAWLALDVHEALAGASEDLPVPARAAIAIVRGIATGDRDPQGHLVRHAVQPPAAELAGMVVACTPVGRTWAPGGLYRLLRRDFRWGDAPSLAIPPGSFPDVPPTMRLYGLERALSREERLATLALAPDDLVGRDAERADLHAAFHQAVVGAGRLVCRVVVGEMGIGKTALVGTFAAELPPDTVLIRVEASSARLDVPFGATGELIRSATGIESDATLEQMTQLVQAALGPYGEGAQGRLVATSLAEIAHGGQAEDAARDDLAYRRKLVLAGLRRLVGAITTRHPLVVVIEGAQWIDRASLEVLAELVKHPVARPVLVVVTTRADERVANLIDGLVRVELRGLSADEQLRLLQARLGVTQGVAEACGDLVPRAAGNPFFLLEMVDAMLERGALEIRDAPDGSHVLARNDAPGAAARALPSTLEQLVGDRIQELPAGERAVVGWLAVAERPMSPADLTRLASLEDEGPVLRLLARGICDWVGETVDFRHPIARDVAYRALEGATRAAMHVAVADHLKKPGAFVGLDAAILARHYARGGAFDQAAAAYLEAGAAARQAIHTVLSTRYYQRALRHLPPDDPRRLEAHEALEAVYRVLGRRRERLHHLGELRRLARAGGSARWAAMALVRTARLDLDEGFLSRGVPHAQKAEATARAAGAHAVEVEAQATLGELLRDLGDVQGALATCDRALRAAEHPDVPARMRGEVLRARGVLLRRVGRVHEAVEAHVEAIAIFRKTGARRMEARAKNALAYALFVLARYEDAIALALESIQIDLSIGGRFQIAKTLNTIGQAYAHLGDLPRALAYLHRARDAHERYADQDSRADTLLVSAEVLVERGDLDAAWLLVGDAGALNAVTGNVYDIVYEKIIRAKLARETGDRPAALVFAFEARQTAEAHALVNFHLLATAVEAVARVEIGEAHTAILLATTAFGSVETIQGAEHGLEIRALCCEALSRAGSPQIAPTLERARTYARQVESGIRDARLRALFGQRRVVRALVGDLAASGSS